MSTVLLIIGWALYAVSLFLPSLREGGFLFAGTNSGWVCLLGSFLGFGAVFGGDGDRRGLYLALLGACNLLMLASPVLYLWVARAANFQRAGFVVAALLVCLTKFVAGGVNTEFLVGYYVWCLSFVAVAAALNLR